jgi:RimJ/RimL family protein N-acetyltransferase
MTVLETPRLLLRPWQESDREPFSRMNADPRVMEFFPKMLDRTESDAMTTRVRTHFERRGFGLWAIEVVGAVDFIGFTGLCVTGFDTHFTPCVEIGWRVAYDHWGRGYATEAARAALKFGFQHLRLDEIVSFTVPANLRSRRVMERLGMTHSSADDFDHPNVPEGHPLRRHVLYRLSREAWERGRETI